MIFKLYAKKYKWTRTIFMVILEINPVTIIFSYRSFFMFLFYSLFFLNIIYKVNLRHLKLHIVPIAVV